MCKVLRLHVIITGLQSIERRKLKLSCVLDSSPICLTKVRIKMLMIIYYSLVICSLAVNNFATVIFCLVKKCWKIAKCSVSILIPLHLP